MELINGYWVDENNNRWSASIYSADVALKMSMMLIGCTNCTDCRYCDDCHNCTNCRYCRYCDDCNYCTGCTGCTGCDNCTSVYCCNGYTQQPQIYSTGRMGSRNDITYIYYGQTDSGIECQVACGCFRGDLDQFEAAVTERHGSNKHAKAYFEVIKKARAMIEV